MRLLYSQMRNLSCHPSVCNLSTTVNIASFRRIYYRESDMLFASTHVAAILNPLRWKLREKSLRTRRLTIRAEIERLGDKVLKCLTGLHARCWQQCLARVKTRSKVFASKVFSRAISDVLSFLALYLSTCYFSVAFRYLRSSMHRWWMFIVQIYVSLRDASRFLALLLNILPPPLSRFPIFI